MIEFGILPHQLVDCTLEEFLFDLNILSRYGVKEDLKDWARNAKKDWLRRHKKS